jgi:predicted metal-dependent hydrolase
MTAVMSHSDDAPSRYLVRYGDREFQYRLSTLAEGKKAAIRVHVHPNGEVEVEAPESAALPEIKAAVQRRARWVLEHLDDIQERIRHVQPRQWVSGESQFYLGRRYVLQLIDDPEQRKVTCKPIGGQILVQGKDLSPERTQGAVRKWYQDRAREVFQRRLDLMVEKLPWVKATPSWRIIEMQTQWGSCTPDGAVLLNPHLLKAPTKAIDYVILHELCHLEEHNHSPRFYGLLDRFMPDWRGVKARLDRHAELFLSDR